MTADNVIQFPTERIQPTPRFLSLNELMEALGGSRTWWNVQIRNGLPRRRWGKGFYRYSLVEVQEWLEDEGNGAA